MYSYETWGERQTDLYLSSLDQAFVLLGEDPNRGVSCDELVAGYRKFRQGRHVIFYREISEGIEIIRILHERMDFESHLFWH